MEMMLITLLVVGSVVLFWFLISAIYSGRIKSLRFLSKVNMVTYLAGMKEVLVYHRIGAEDPYKWLYKPLYDSYNHQKENTLKAQLTEEQYSRLCEIIPEEEIEHMMSMNKDELKEYTNNQVEKFTKNLVKKKNEFKKGTIS